MCPASRPCSPLRRHSPVTHSFRGSHDTAATDVFGLPGHASSSLGFDRGAGAPWRAGGLWGVARAHEPLHIHDYSARRTANDLARHHQARDYRGLTQQLASMKAQILSRSSLQPIIEEFNLYPKDVNRVPPDEMVERLRDSIEVSALKEMDDTKAQGLPGFTISVTLDNPIAARDICGKLTSLFISSAAEARQQASNQTTDFLQQRLDVAKRNLDEQGQKIADFK